MRRRRQVATVTAAIVAAATLAFAAPQTAGDRELNLETFDEAWRIINETHWDPEFNGVDWEAVRDELRPRAGEAGSSVQLRAVIIDMIGRLGQSHFAVWPRGALGSLRADEGGGGAPTGARRADGAARGGGDPGFATVLVDDRFLVARVDPQGPAAEAGVRPGWVVLRINGVELDTAALAAVEGVERHKVLVEAQRGMDRRLSRRPGEALDLQFLDGDDQRRELKVRVVRPEGKLSTFGNMPPFFARLESRLLEPDVGISVGVIGFNIWLPQLARAFDGAIDTMRDAQGIILDLRGNPGGVGAMVMGFGGHFVEEYVSLGTMRTRDGELRFVANPRRINTSGELVDPFAGQLAILIDSTSGSTSEVFAGGLQAIGRARVFGQRSMGAVLPSLMDELPNGDILQHAFADFVVTATGERLEGRGVVPDQEITISRADLLAGRDPAMEAAVEWIVRQQQQRPAGGEGIRQAVEPPGGTNFE